MKQQLPDLGLVEPEGSRRFCLALGRFWQVLVLVLLPAPAAPVAPRKSHRSGGIEVDMQKTPKVLLCLQLGTC